MIGMEHREQLFRLLQQRMFSVQAKKGRDYGEENDGLRNLRRRGVRGVFGRMEDKMIRLDILTKPGRQALVEDESIEDTLIDLANYSLLLIILMWDESGKFPDARVEFVNPLTIHRIDEKHEIRAELLPEGTIQVRIYKSTNNTPIPDEEPVILFRARDKLALPMLDFYLGLCQQEGATQYQLDSMTKMILRFRDFAGTHSDVMKQPGITLGK
jgi:hypothetical protein